MAHWSNLITKEELDIVGRGITLLVDIQENHLTPYTWMEHNPIKTGDKLLHKGDLYTITGVETKRNLLDGRLSSLVSLIIKKTE